MCLRFSSAKTTGKCLLYFLWQSLRLFIVHLLFIVILKSFQSENIKYFPILGLYVTAPLLGRGVTLCSWWCVLWEAVTAWDLSFQWGDLRSSGGSLQWGNLRSPGGSLTSRPWYLKVHPKWPHFFPSPRGELERSRAWWAPPTWTDGSFLLLSPSQELAKWLPLTTGKHSQVITPGFGVGSTRLWVGSNLLLLWT